MHTAIAKTLSIASLALLATGALAADRLNANDNTVIQSNSGARAQQKIRIGVMDAPIFGSARVNANNNSITQSNSAARARQTIEIGVFK